MNASDYIHDTQELRDAFAAFRHARPNDPGVVVTGGQVSPQARTTLAEFGLELNEIELAALDHRASR